MNANSTIALRIGEVILPASVARTAATSPFRGHSSARVGSFRPSRSSLRTLRAQLRQGPQPREVVGRHRQRQKLVDLIQSLHHHLADRADEVAPAEALFDALSPALADLVAGVSRGASVDGAATGAVDVLRHVRCDVDLAARLDEALGVVRFVGAHRRCTSRMTRPSQVRSRLISRRMRCHCLACA